MAFKHRHGKANVYFNSICGQWMLADNELGIH